MTTEESTTVFLNKLAQKAGQYEIKANNCCQGTLLALQEEFKLGDSSILKAATAFPGIALRGETCGAVVGAIMALGLVFGRDDITDMDGLVRAMQKARLFCRRFEEIFGSTMCRDVQKLIMGRTYDIAKAKGLKEYEKDRGTHKCSQVAAYAARIAGEIILSNS